MIKEKGFIPCAKLPLEEILYKHNYISSYDNNIWEKLIYEKFCPHKDKKGTLCLNKKINSKGYCKRHNKKEYSDIIKCSFLIKDKNRICNNLVRKKGLLCHKHKRYKIKVEDFHEIEKKNYFDNPFLNTYYPFDYKYNLLYYNNDSTKNIIKEVNKNKYTPTGYLILQNTIFNYNFIIKYNDFNKYLISIYNSFSKYIKKERFKKIFLIKVRFLVKLKISYNNIQDKKKSLIKYFIYNLLDLLIYKTSEYLHIAIINIVKEYLELSNTELDYKYISYLDILEERENWELHSNVSNFYNTSYSCTNCRKLYYDNFDDSFDENNELSNVIIKYKSNNYFNKIIFNKKIYNYIYEYNNNEFFKYLLKIYSSNNTNILNIIKIYDNVIDQQKTNKKKKINKKVYLEEYKKFCIFLNQFDDLIDNNNELKLIRN